MIVYAIREYDERRASVPIIKLFSTIKKAEKFVAKVVDAEKKDYDYRLTVTLEWVG